MAIRVGFCFGDPDCADGAFCKSDKKCAEFDREYCDKNECGLGDGGSLLIKCDVNS